MPWWIEIPGVLFAAAVVFIAAWCAVVAPGDRDRLAEALQRELQAGKVKADA